MSMMDRGNHPHIAWTLSLFQVLDSNSSVMQFADFSDREGSDALDTITLTQFWAGLLLVATLQWIVFADGKIAAQCSISGVILVRLELSLGLYDPNISQYIHQLYIYTSTIYIHQLYIYINYLHPHQWLGVTSTASCVDGAQGLGMESTTVEPGAFRGWRIPVVGCQRAVGKPINLFYIIWGFPPLAGRFIMEIHVNMIYRGHTLGNLHLWNTKMIFLHSDWLLAGSQRILPCNPSVTA